MRHWDASALVALLVKDAHTTCALRAWREDPDLTTWWGSYVECAAAISRLEREGALDAPRTEAALERLRQLAGAWHETIPSAGIRDLAARLLRVHPLRAADALQLAAALVAAEHRPAGFGFLTFDTRLELAARREGFAVGP